MNTDNIKITKDGFVWKVIDYETAKDILNNGTFQVFGLMENDAEGLIENRTDLEEHDTYGIEVGHIEKLNSESDVDSPWSINEVKEKYNCTDAEARIVLNQALENEATMEQIWFAIGFHADDMNLSPKTS